MSNCPKILQVLFEQGMDGTPSKRPEMSFVFEIMTYFDALINKEPIKPIVERSASTDLGINLSDNKLNHGYGSM